MMLKQPNVVPCALFMKLSDCEFLNVAMKWSEQTGGTKQTITSFQEIKSLSLKSSPGIILLEVQQPDCTLRQILTFFQNSVTSVVPVICFHSDELSTLCELSLEFEFIPAIKESNGNAVWETLAVASTRSREKAETASKAEDLHQIISHFSAEQRKLLELWIEGCPNKQLAAELDVCLRTVQLRKQAILSALNAGSINEIILRFAKCGVEYQA